ncbi:hypothetical protein JWV37_10825, partial [Sulfurospirillum sp. T05]
DYIIVAKTKKDALEAYRSLGYLNYEKKDMREIALKEINILSLELIPRNMEYGFCNCFSFSLNVQLETPIAYKDIIIPEAEATYKALIKLFKEQNKEFLKNHF